MLYMVTFTINIPQMVAYIPYMDPMGCAYTIHGARFIINELYPIQMDHCDELYPIQMDQRFIINELYPIQMDNQGLSKPTYTGYTIMDPMDPDTS